MLIFFAPDAVNPVDSGLALANRMRDQARRQLGGARILFTEDLTLRGDFRRIIHGDIYDTRNSSNVTTRHRSLLRRPCN